MIENFGRQDHLFILEFFSNVVIPGENPVGIGIDKLDGVETSRTVEPNCTCKILRVISIRHLIEINIHGDVAGIVEFI